MLASTPPVLAQGIYLEEAKPPVSAGAHGNAFELGVSAGFTDGWGTLGTSNAGVQRPGAGGALEVSPSWRVLPVLALGIYGFGAQLTDTAAIPAAADVLQAGAGIQGTVHLVPEAAGVDPWISLGSGWRGQWFAYHGGGSATQQGWDFVQARAGLDARVNPGLALGPVIGASLSRYYSEEVQGGPWTPVGGNGVNVYVFAGVRATVDYALHPRRP